MANERSNAIIGQEVKLEISYTDINGYPITPDAIPTVEILNASGTSIYTSTTDVYRIDEGLYQILFTVPDDSVAGVFNDVWSAVIGGQTLQTTFTFTVVDASVGVAPTTGPGRIKIGDDIDFGFSDEEIYGINVLLKFLKARLNSTGVKPKVDEFGAFVRDVDGNIVEEECNVFTDEALVVFLLQSLSEFNSTPFFTAYTFADRLIYTTFSNLIIEGAYVSAIAAQSIVEKGRDFTISDGGINYTPPQLGDFFQSHYSGFLSSYRERLKFVKNSIRPGPVYYTTTSSFTTGNPAWARLRHLRSRRIY